MIPSRKQNIESRNKKIQRAGADSFSIFYFLPSNISSRGFTLVEMLVVIAIATLILIVITDAILTFYRANTNTFEQAVQVDEARKGIDRVGRDIREAAYSDNGSFPIVSTGTSSLSFYSDIDRDASVELIRYYLVGSILYKGVIDATGTPPTYNPANEKTSIISTYVRNTSQNIPVFRYYNASSTEIAAGTSTTAIVFVTTDLVVNVDVNRLPGEFTLHSSATIRNLEAY